MKAVLGKTSDLPDTLVVEELPDIVPGPGAAEGKINRSSLLVRCRMEKRLCHFRIPRPLEGRQALPNAPSIRL